MTGSTAGGGAQLSSRSRKPTNNEPPKSGGADKISYADSLGDELTERTLFELAAFREMEILTSPKWVGYMEKLQQYKALNGTIFRPLQSKMIAATISRSFLYQKRITLLRIAIGGSRKVFINHFYQALLSRKVIVKK